MQLKVKMGYSDREVCIKQKDAREEHKILGIWVSPAGRNKERKAALVEKVSTWCDQMEKSRLPGSLKHRSYKTRLWPQVRYSLGVAQLSKNEMRETIGQQR